MLVVGVVWSVAPIATFGVVVAQITNQRRLSAKRFPCLAESCAMARLTISTATKNARHVFIAIGTLNCLLARFHLQNLEQNVDPKSPGGSIEMESRSAATGITLAFIVSLVIPTVARSIPVEALSAH
jgi:hypothetical protein